MHTRFGLTLMVNHACNLRCTYCYTGEKFPRAMPVEIGRRAILRALRSLRPGGTLELGFFGGEPLIEASLILELIEFALERADRLSVALEVGLTTNGTIETRRAWTLMTMPGLRLAISHDGLPRVHDRHRRTPGGEPTSARVLGTMRKLSEAGKPFRVVLVVRPDGVARLAAGIAYLYDQGVRTFDPSLDLWATWTRADGETLERSIAACASFWADHLPDCSVSWFDAKAAAVAKVPTHETARCGFGFSEIAVAPSGNLYPCERLIGADEPSNPMRLPGRADEGDDFLALRPAANKSAAECTGCALSAMCSTTCRCSNYVRTGNATRPDGLLCLWDQACFRETVRAIQARAHFSLSR